MISSRFVFVAMLCLSAWLVSSVPLLAQPEGHPLLGTWGSTNSTSRIEFLGNGIAREETGGAVRWIRSIEKSGWWELQSHGSAAVRRCRVVGSSLEVDSGTGSVESWSRISAADPACSRNRQQWAGARELFRAEHGETLRPGLKELLHYLERLPVCPDGGAYSPGKGSSPPACSRCGNQP